MLVGHGGGVFAYLAGIMKETIFNGITINQNGIIGWDTGSFHGLTGTHLQWGTVGVQWCNNQEILEDHGVHASMAVKTWWYVFPFLLEVRHFFCLEMLLIIKYKTSDFQNIAGLGHKF